MKLTKSQKTYVTILVLALVGLAVDQLFLGGDQTGPETIQASEPYDGPVTGSFAPATAGGPETTSLADRLSAARTALALDVETARDAFAPSDSWQAQLTPPKTETPIAQTPAGAGPAAAEIFTQRHTLMSVIQMDDGGVALIDEKVLQVGAKLDGFTLIELTETTAVFRSGDLQAELRLPAQSGQ